MTDRPADTLELVRRRHPEHTYWQGHWKWLLDSYEGGLRYRDAVYGHYRGLPLRNLVRHKREYPDPRSAQLAGFDSVYAAGLAADFGTPGAGVAGVDASSAGMDDDFEVRRARTPVPTFVAEAIETHLAKIYGKEVAREGPPDLTEWWDDVDGLGTRLDEWLEQAIAPLFLTLGQLDLCVDHPPNAEGEPIRSMADVRRLKLDGAVASYILPENMLWWKLDTSGAYAECLVREYVDDPAPGASAERYRHWTAEGSTLYDDKGEVLAATPHPFGAVPIRRVFYRRRPRTRHVGWSHYEGIAERQREYYNRDSELILSDSLQAHPLLQGPEDYVQADGTVPIGPAWLLPKKKNSQGGAATYEGFEVVDFPKGGAESIRQNKVDLRDEVDRDAKLAKPAGVANAGSGTVSQSGVSKQLDSQGGHERCTRITGALGRLEMTLHELALMVLRDGRQGDAIDGVSVVYPSEFDLQSAEELAAGQTAFQALLSGAGECPLTQALMLRRLARAIVTGEPPATYDAIDEEVEAAVQASAAYLAAERAAAAAPAPDEDPGGTPEGDEGRSPAAPDYSPYPGAIAP